MKAARPVIDIDELARRCALACDERKGENIRILDVRKSLAIADYFVIATGKNRRHLRSMGDGIRELCRELKRQPPKEEGGTDGGKWLLLDLGDLIVHLFDGETRRHYDIDALWADAPVVTFAP